MPQEYAEVDVYDFKLSTHPALFRFDIIEFNLRIGFLGG